MKIEFEYTEQAWAFDGKPLPLKPTIYLGDTQLVFPSGTVVWVPSEIRSGIVDDTGVVKKDITGEHDFILDLVATTLHPEGRFK